MGRVWLAAAPRNSVSPIWPVPSGPQGALHASDSSPSPQNAGEVGGLPLDWSESLDKQGFFQRALGDKQVTKWPHPSPGFLILSQTLATPLTPLGPESCPHVQMRPLFSSGSLEGVSDPTCQQLLLSACHLPPGGGKSGLELPGPGPRIIPTSLLPSTPGRREVLRAMPADCIRPGPEHPAPCPTAAAPAPRGPPASGLPSRTRWVLSTTVRVLP